MLKKLWLIFAQAVTVCAAALLVFALWQRFEGGWPQKREFPALKSEAGVLSYSEAVRRTAPSVVNIYTTEPTEDADLPEAENAGNPKFWRYGASPLGSGVLVSRNGFMLTNYHVVEGISEISAALSDGREYEAKLVGTDPETDLALLKIEAENLPAIEFGSSSMLQVGDVVLAIGNPFNVGQTVTLGIVSALGRHSLGLNSFEDFIQTDAAINRGNSGGALVNTAGQLVGINTAIFSPDVSAGGSVGIGFAIPSELINDVLPDLMKTGRVRRGYLGLVPQEVTREAASQYGVAEGVGVIVAAVEKGAAAWAAGIREGDVITEIDGEAVSDVAVMMRRVARMSPGKAVEVRFIRAGKRWKTRVTLQVRPLKKKN